MSVRMATDIRYETDEDITALLVAADWLEERGCDSAQRLRLLADRMQRGAAWTVQIGTALRKHNLTISDGWSLESMSIDRQLDHERYRMASVEACIRLRYEGDGSAAEFTQGATA